MTHIKVGKMECNPYLSFLITTAVVTFEFVVTTKSLCVAETA
jgi:hypothetical protein